METIAIVLLEQLSDWKPC